MDLQFEEVQYYVYGLAGLLLTGLILFVFFKPFRKGLIRYIQNHVFFLVIFGLYLSVYVITRLFFFEEVFVHIYTEDGLFEYLTALFFLIASFFFSLAYFNARDSLGAYMNAVILALAGLCFFTGMEEISWGQRILGIDTPDAMREINYQEEITLHNLIDARHYGWIYAIISLCLLAFFAFRHTPFTSFFGIPRAYMPSRKFLGIALLFPLISWYEREHFEAVLSFVFCVYGYQVYQESVQGSLQAETVKAANEYGKRDSK